MKIWQDQNISKLMMDLTMNYDLMEDKLTRKPVIDRRVLKKITLSCPLLSYDPVVLQKFILNACHILMTTFNIENNNIEFDIKKDINPFEKLLRIGRIKYKIEKVSIKCNIELFSLNDCNRIKQEIYSLWVKTLQLKNVSHKHSGSIELEDNKLLNEYEKNINK